MRQILPDCMMPTGADPCAGYQQLATHTRTLEAVLSGERADYDKRTKYINELEAELTMRNMAVARTDAEIGRVKAERDALRSAIRSLKLTKEN